LDIRKVMFCLFEVWAFEVIWKKSLEYLNGPGAHRPATAVPYYCAHRSHALHTHPAKPVVDKRSLSSRCPTCATRLILVASLLVRPSSLSPARYFPLLTPPCLSCSPLHVECYCLLEPHRRVKCHQGTVLVRLALPSTGAFFHESSRRPPRSRHELDAIAPSASSSSTEASCRRPPPVPPPPPQPPPEWCTPHRLDLPCHRPLLQPSTSVPHSSSRRCCGECRTVGPSPSWPQNGSTAPQRCSSPFHPPSLTAGESDAAGCRRPAHMHSGLCQFPVIYFWIKWIGFKLQKFGRNSNNLLKLSNHFWYLNSNIFYRIKI
jgi:hypothetical protein